MCSARTASSLGSIQMSLGTALFVDMLVILGCFVALRYRADLRHSHPAVLYLGFHIMVVTLRAIAIYGGAPTFLSETARFQGATVEEIARAVQYADIALIAATIGWLHYAKWNQRRSSHGATLPPQRGEGVTRWRPLRSSVVIKVTLVAMPLGLYTLSKYALIPGSDAGLADVRSFYAVLAMTWPGLLLVALIYLYGFRFLLIVPLTAYLAIIAIQGYHRFRLILPIILLCQIYLDRRQKRWPGPVMVGLLVFLMLLFFPLKSIGRQIQAGASFSDILSSTAPTISDSVQGRSGDSVILDQLALSLALTDDYGRTFFGTPYLHVLILPVPRTLWPEKPGLADHIKEISKPERPIGELGSVTTLVGELYLNFRLPGLVVFAYLLARISSRLHKRAYESPYLSVTRLLYLLVACNLIQVYRDGLISVPVLLLVQMLPLMVIAAIHWRGPRTRKPGGMRQAHSSPFLGDPFRAVGAAALGANGSRSQASS